MCEGRCDLWAYHIIPLCRSKPCYTHRPGSLQQGAHMIDSHSHIYTERYQDDRDAVIARAVAAGVTQLLQVGCDLEESRSVVALSARVAGIYAAVGVHPHQATTVGADVLDALEAL